MDRKSQSTLSGARIFAVVGAAVAIILLSQIGSQAKFSTAGNLGAQPAFWPAVSLIAMVLFALAHLVLTWRRGVVDTDDEGRVPASRVVEVFLLLECFAWFMIYVALVPVTGYLATTLLFSLLLAWRSGYRSRRMLIASLVMGLLVVLFFKTFLGVKIPGGAVYAYLPDALRNFMIVRF